jgi:hypothetical protein
VRPATLAQVARLIGPEHSPSLADLFETALFPD